MELNLQGVPGTKLRTTLVMSNTPSSSTLHQDHFLAKFPAKEHVLTSSSIAK